MRYSGRYGLALPEGATTPLARSVAVGELERHGGPAQTQGPNRAVAGEEGTVRSAAGPGEASADRVSGMRGSTSSSVRGRAFGAMKPLLLARPGGSAGQRLVAEGSGNSKAGPYVNRSGFYNPPHFTFQKGLAFYRSKNFLMKFF